MRRLRARSKQKLSTAIAITCFTLASCATTTADTASSSTGEPETGGADTATIDVQTPATFDPKDPNFKLFDPCTELPDEVFKEAGLGKRSRFGNEPGADYKICTFQTAPDAGFFGSVSVIMNAIDFDTIQRKMHVIRGTVNANMPGVYQYREAEDQIHDCSSVAQSSGGQLEVTVTDLDKKLSSSEVCDQSLAYLQFIYPEVEQRLNNGTHSDRFRDAESPS
ncbi:DUF3558 domain-containing protein [Corynebacterium sp. H128]|uniref:DUF3558 domain-containing protein n=1 Tax=unclassified Corynebacterium TaxID=2624378 RepID=UPI0030B4AB9B